MSFDFVAWLRRSALPLWGEAGVDRDMFVERMDLDGRPLVDVPRRVMVQARQIFVFAEAQARGWFPGGEIAERAGEAMVSSFRHDGGGWIFSAAPDGRPIDETRDLYAQAFVLFALAGLKRLTGSDRWLALADATLGFLDAHLATPATGGYAESVPVRPGPRRQNPHMHLLEALLALDEVAPDRSYRRRAEAMIDLFEVRFLHGPGPVLVESYDVDLRPLVGPPFAFEPGHHFEWAWLLAKNADLCGRARPALAESLCGSARRFGATSDGVFFDEVDGNGAVRVASTRLWPCTEAIKASAFGLGVDDATSSAHALAGAMGDRFLRPATEGCWIDHFGADGAPLSSYVPASSLYHLVGAAIVLADLTC